MCGGTVEPIVRTGATRRLIRPGMLAIAAAVPKRRRRPACHSTLVGGVEGPGSVAPSVMTGVVIGVGDLLLVQEHPVGLSCQRLPMKLPQR